MYEIVCGYKYECNSLGWNSDEYEVEVWDGKGVKSYWTSLYVKLFSVVLPAEALALFHLIPMFWPRLWHKVMAIAPTLPYCKLKQTY